MKSSAPWSVKGIERDARETAKEAAKREGMTVGEWLNQIIYTAGGAEETDGEIEGLKLRDIVTAVEHLNKRTAEAEAKNVDAVGELTRNIGGIVERVQRLERVKPAEGSHGDITARLEKLEKAGGDRQRIEALKALEKAVAQIAAQFNSSHKTSLERLDSNERQLQKLSARMEGLGAGDDDAAGAGFLREAIDGLSTRISRAERIAIEAAELKAQASGSVDTTFVERTGERLRVLGDEIKRGGDQIRGFETTISKLSAQIDAAERRSAEGVQKVADTISDLREQFTGEAGQRPTSEGDSPAPAKGSRAGEQETGSQQSVVDDLKTQIEANIGAASDSAADETDSEEPPENLSVGRIGAFGFGSDSDDGTSSTLQTENQPAAEEPDSNEDIGDDSDPFSFADEIEAAIEDPSEAGEEFSFDLDDDEQEGSQNAKSLLSEVQEVFGKHKPASDAKNLYENAPENKTTDASLDDDLDAILADLDDAPEAAAQNDPDDESDAEKNRTTAKALLFGGTPSITKESSEGPAEEVSEETSIEAKPKEDFLQAARRRAKEAAEQAENSNKPRRKLTPKQRAILAARARQKRLTAAQSDPSPTAMETPSSEEETQAQSHTEPAIAEGKDEAARSAKIISAITALRNKLPLIGKSQNQNEEPEEKTATIDAVNEAVNEPKSDQEPDGNSAAFATLKATATAKPVTLALGVAIFLAAAALFFLVKDLVTKSPPADTSPPTATVSENEISGAIASSTEKQAVAENAPQVPAASAVDPRALYLESMTALNNSSSSEETTAAISKLEEAAALGHPPAQLQLGELYKIGQGVEQDLGQARTWFRRAANGGNILAMHRIGVMTARGDGGPADTAAAIGWFELAANRGLVDSQYNLGAIYHPSDSGTSSSVQDAGKAYFWYSLAARNGDDQATPLAAGVAGALTPAQREDLNAQITEWKVQPADDAANEMAPVSN
jgi:localization factor PodJL